MCRDKWQNWALAPVYTETNGAGNSVGEMLLHSRLSRLLIDMNCDCIGEQFPSVPNSVILQRKNLF